MFDNHLGILTKILPFFSIDRFTLCVGGGSKSTSSQSADNSTKVSTTNQQVGASEGSTAVGANSNYDTSSGNRITATSGASIQTVDSAGLKASLESASVANQALADVAKTALSSANKIKAESETSGLDDKTKKILIYGGGGLVALVLVVILLKGNK